MSHDTTATNISIEGCKKHCKTHKPAPCCRKTADTLPVDSARIVKHCFLQAAAHSAQQHWVVFCTLLLAATDGRVLPARNVTILKQGTGACRHPSTHPGEERELSPITVRCVYPLFFFKIRLCLITTGVPTFIWPFTPSAFRQMSRHS